MAGDPVAGHVIAISRLSALRGFGRLRGGLDRRLPGLERRLLRPLQEVAELGDSLLVALHAQVEQAQARIDRGVLRAERCLEDRFALGGPGAQELAAKAARLVDVRARGPIEALAFSVLVRAASAAIRVASATAAVADCGMSFIVVVDIGGLLRL